MTKLLTLQHFCLVVMWLIFCLYLAQENKLGIRLIPCFRHAVVDGGREVGGLGTTCCTHLATLLQNVCNLLCSTFSEYVVLKCSVDLSEP